MNHYVYIIECSNGHYYTGYTTDVERRYREHVKGNAKCKYTRSFPPKQLAASWCFDANHSLALKIEHKIKRMTRLEKQQLINEPHRLQDLL